MIEQLVIGVCGIATVWLSQSTERDVQRYACLFGVLAQPAWFYATIVAEQWGMFALTVVYTLGWLRGVWNFWIVSRRAS